MLLLLALIALPLIEIALFVTLGGALGLWLSLLWVVLAAFLGIIVLKGIAMLGPVSLSRNMNEFSDPMSPLAHRLLVVLAGCLLLVPGFFTDFIGLLLLIPAVRTVAIRLIGRRFQVVQHHASVQVDLPEGEWRDVDTDGPAKADPQRSELTRH